jgi:hypothetical protein
MYEALGLFTIGAKFYTLCFLAGADLDDGGRARSKRGRSRADRTLMGQPGAGKGYLFSALGSRSYLGRYLPIDKVGRYLT